MGFLRRGEQLYDKLISDLVYIEKLETLWKLKYWCLDEPLVNEWNPHCAVSHTSTTPIAAQFCRE